jgi:hypothetical protein
MLPGGYTNLEMILRGCCERDQQVEELQDSTAARHLLGGPGSRRVFWGR